MLHTCRVCHQGPFDSWRPADFVPRVKSSFFENLQDFLYFIICSIFIVEVGFWLSTHAHLEPPWRARSHTPRSCSRAPKHSMRLQRSAICTWSGRAPAQMTQVSWFHRHTWAEDDVVLWLVHSMLSRSVERQRFRVGRRKGFSGGQKSRHYRDV